MCDNMVAMEVSYDDPDRVDRAYIGSLVLDAEGVGQPTPMTLQAPPPETAARGRGSVRR